MTGWLIDLARYGEIELIGNNIAAATPHVKKAK